MFSQSVIRYGVERPLPTRTHLRAGPLSLIYENGDLRYVKLGDRELLRRVYVAVRDHNWGTIHPVLSDVEMEITETAFAIRYAARHQQGDIDFIWHADLRGSDDGTVVFRMAGEALSTFRRNRIGFCILHPMGCAGDLAVIEHSDGSVEESRFPVQIAPQLSIDGTIRPVHPFADMRSLSHEVLAGLMAKVTFSGDIFEMEDQRNWTDASYKTYSTPLALPFPVEVTAGTKIVQSVTLTLAREGIGEEKVEDRGNGDVVSIVVDRERTKSLPTIGLGVASHGQPLHEQEFERLRALNLSHLRVDLALADPGHIERLHEAARQAKVLNVPLEVAIFLSDNGDHELLDLRAQLDAIAAPVCRWLVFHRDESVTPAGLVALAHRRLGDYAPDARFGAGSNAYFTDINRQHPDTDNIDFLTYSLNPQVHAFDNVSLMETVAAQAVTVESASRFAGGKDIVVSPVTLLPRFNPNATGPEPEPAPGALPPQVDVRQMSLFGAAWTVGSLKYLLGSDLDAVTYFETTGWRGVMEQKGGCPLPDKFHSQPGMVFPLYHVLADVGEFNSLRGPQNLEAMSGQAAPQPRGGNSLGQAGLSQASSEIGGGRTEVVNASTSDPLRVDGLALRREDELTLLIANLGPQTQQVQIDGMGSLARIRRLDESTFEEAIAHPKRFRKRTETLTSSDGRFVGELAPYAVVRIDANVKMQALLDECLPLIKAMGRGRKAITIGGSYGKGTSDRRSDVDFRLFCDETVASNLQETEVWRSFHAAVERWRAEGIDIDYCWVRKVQQIEMRLNAWLGGEVKPDDYVWCLWGYHLLTDLANQVVLDDPDGLIAGWQARLTPFSHTLQRAIIDKHMASLNYWRNDYHYRNKVERNDTVFLAGITSRLVHDMLQVLFALNETYYVGDGKNLDYAAGFSVLPDDFVARVQTILYPERSESMFIVQYERLMELINEVAALAQRVS